MASSCKLFSQNVHFCKDICRDTEYVSALHSVNTCSKSTNTRPKHNLHSEPLHMHLFKGILWNKLFWNFHKTLRKTSVMDSSFILSCISRTPTQKNTSESLLFHLSGWCRHHLREKLVKSVKNKEINPFHDTGLFIHPLKTPENLWFSVFWRYRKRVVAWNGLNNTYSVELKQFSYQWTLVKLVKLLIVPIQ